jgi:hypothetical protein
VSVRKCPDCGQDVSTSASACPHCGRPNRRWSLSPEILAYLVLAIAGAGVLAWYSASRDSGAVQVTAPVTPETVIAEPYRQLAQGLSANVGYNRKLLLFRIENRDSFPWSNCQLSLNGQGISSGYVRQVDTIRPGLTEAALLPIVDFTDGSGRKFDPALSGAATLDLDCETPHGHRYYYGKFPPG